MSAHSAAVAAIGSDSFARLSLCLYLFRSPELHLSVISQLSSFTHPPHLSFLRRCQGIVRPTTLITGFASAINIPITAYLVSTYGFVGAPLSQVFSGWMQLISAFLTFHFHSIFIPLLDMFSFTH